VSVRTYPTPHGTRRHTAIHGALRRRYGSPLEPAHCRSAPGSDSGPVDRDDRHYLPRLDEEQGPIKFLFVFSRDPILLRAASRSANQERSSKSSGPGFVQIFSPSTTYSRTSRKQRSSQAAMVGTASGSNRPARPDNGPARRGCRSGQRSFWAGGRSVDDSARLQQNIGTGLGQLRPDRFPRRR